MRIVVIGSSGSGKSTLAHRLSDALDLPRVELDALNWGPGWLNRSADDPDDFARRVEAATAGDRWITDGNYRAAMTRTLLRATDLIWLDYPRRIIMPRVIRRSVMRALDRQELWAGSGNREDFRRWLDKDHPIRWAWDTFERRRGQYEILFADERIATVRKHRLRHPREALALEAKLAADALFIPASAAIL
jgi:adenylate kinase family enzyme